GSHPACDHHGLVGPRPRIGATAPATPRGHLRGPRHRRASQHRGAPARGGRDARPGARCCAHSDVPDRPGACRGGECRTPGVDAPARPGAEGRLMSTPHSTAARSAAPRSATTRTVAVTVPDWPLLAALDRHQRRSEEQAAQQSPNGETASAPAPLDLTITPVVLLEEHRVTHAGPAAREAGAMPGMTRRAARAACPEALVLEADREHDSALFELVAAAVDTIAAGVDVLRPGVLLMSARGPARHQG